LQTAREELPKAYDSGAVEQRLYQTWTERGYFTPRIDRSKKPFVIIMPPPNVTGELHLGHALTAALEDTMVRWHRMLGEPTLWLPGTDHAGIATQVVVEKELAKEKQNRHQMGREKFQQRVWEWVRKYGSAITEQHKRLGASCDWSRNRFTLDPGPSKAVLTTFVNLYRKGLIYRGERITNWCPRCATALSDLETEHEETQGHLWHIRYPLADGSGFVTVATTRPETLLGDTAVAVNPKDPRYEGMIGRKVVVPAVKREIPIVGDDAVDTSFGTGALKVTPAHDPVDFDIAQRHGLPAINVMRLDATLNENAGPYEGMERFECRKRIVADLERDGLLVKIDPHVHSVGHCQRCKTIVEPILSKQWFVKMEPLAKPAIHAVESGATKIIPERFTKVYLNWMNNIRDWCISRQLWWGHRIPVWYCGDCARLTVQVDTPSKCAHCGSPKLQQDPDVLDTWFSSALWPHSTLGWPDQTEDLQYFYPTTVMETGYDILFFWVARMITMGMENMGQTPFQTVYLHGLIRDEKGDKMSKVRGNVINPLTTAKQYGTDALRFALTTGTTPGNDVRLGAPRLEAARNFANKIWNASRFVIMSIDQPVRLESFDAPPPGLHREDRWILSRLNRTVARVNQLFAEFQFGEAEREMYEFIWGEFCDWYIEVAKIRLRQRDASPSPLPVLVHTLEKMMRLLHPVMPFITEEIWQTLCKRLQPDPQRTESVMIAPYPIANERLADAAAEREMALVLDVVRAIRNARAEYRVEPNKTVDAIVEVEEGRTALEDESAAMRVLARVGNLRIVGKGGRPSDMGPAFTAVLASAVVYVPLAGVVDIEAERARLRKEQAEAQEAMARLEGRLNNEQFTSKAPAEVVEKERERLASLQGKVRNTQERLRELG